MKQARYFEKREDAVQCFLCRHHCVIKKGHTGICGVRKNVEGVLVALTYAKAIAKHLDPIEKKPLFHFFPGSVSYSIATVGCNFRCLYCQNYDISQMPKEEGTILGEHYPPEEVVSDAENSGAKSIAYTYTEPTIFFEYAFDTAKLAKERGLYNIFVTNGYTEDKPLTDIKPYLDAANVDLKGFREEFYKKVCGATLKGVLDTLKHYKKLGIWIEVTTLVIPKYNDSDEELKDIAKFIKNELSEDTPWHVTAFYPTYKLLDAPPTSAKTLRRAWEIGKSEGLFYVYTGNIPGEKGESTFCPKCGKVIIERVGFSIRKNNLKGSDCGFCGEKISGIF
ncbi:MAG: AmmeMemoRadiSam system radical SAM enzyme [bacterium]